MVANISSMTAFARVGGSNDGARWVWELKSVNGRGLEQRFRLPPGTESLEPKIRKIVASKLARGNINAALSLNHHEGETRYVVNKAALTSVIEAIETLQARLECATPQPEGILAIRGVIEPEESSSFASGSSELLAAIEQSFLDCLALLIENRKLEGTALGVVLENQIAEAEVLSSNAAQNAEAEPARIMQRLHDQLQELLGDASLPPERISQEAAALAIKADIREEIDRLNAHCRAARGLLSKGGPIGREFDFLVQEFNREANTLCSKAADMELKAAGLALKKVIDQMREQVQNVE